MTPHVAPRDRRHWVFDMDGTLTVAAHDFALIRRALGVAPGDDILDYLAGLPAAQAEARHAWLMAHERELARQSTAAPGACELVRALRARGDRIAILTRNAQVLATLTLDCIGLGEEFPADAVLGRESAPPKPRPDGLLQLAARWQVAPDRLVMVGDHAHDLRCGRAAGALTVLVGPENRWPALADVHVTDCHALMGLVGLVAEPVALDAH
ncbi:MAG: HAD family hydrolase [Pseudoxanthomonas sp.]